VGRKTFEEAVEHFLVKHLDREAVDVYF